MSLSIYKKVGLASFIMMSSVFLSRVFGVLREMVIAYLAGTSGAVDAYQISFIIPELLNHLLTTGFLSITFIPIFTRYLTEDREQEAWKIFSNIFNTLGIILIVLMGISFVFTEYLIDLTGIENPENFQEAVQMTRIIIPAQFFFFAGGIMMAVQFARERFLIPALAPLIYNAGIIVGGLFLYKRVGMAGFSWGVLLGAFVGNFLVQWIGARRAGLKWYPIINPRHPEFKKYLWLTLPLMLGLTMTFNVEIMPRFFGSYLSPGSVASLNYGLRIMFLLVGVLGQAVGVASYPYLTQMAAENRIGEMNKLLNATLKRISLVIPCSVLVILLRREIVFLLFERGHFNSVSTLITSDILIFLMIGSFAFTAQTIVNRGYYAIQNTLFPSIYVTIAVIISLPLYYLGMIKMEVYGVALALSLSTILQVVLLFALWNRSSQNRAGRSVYLFYIKMFFLSAVIGVILFGFKHLVLNDVDVSTVFGSLVNMISVSMVFVAVVLLAGYMFKIKEIFEISDLILQKILKINQSKDV